MRSRGMLESAPGLAAALLVFGGAMGTIDVAMNIQAVALEKAAARPIIKHHPSERKIVRVYIVFRRKGDGRRLTIRTLYEPHANARLEHARKVIPRAVQVRLQANPDAGIRAAQVLYESERRIDVGRLLHVDPQVTVRG